MTHVLADDVTLLDVFDAADEVLLAVVLLVGARRGRHWGRHFLRGGTLGTTVELL